MKAAVLIAGLISFAWCVTFHVALWRLRRPRSDIRALVLIFLIVPTMVGVAALAMLPLAPEGMRPTVPEVGAILLLHLALASAYVQTYPAAQAESPSLEIAYVVGKSMPRGVSREELLVVLAAAALVRERVDDLVANRLVRVEGERYVLTPLSSRLIRAVLGFRALLGLPKPGG